MSDVQIFDLKCGSPLATYKDGMSDEILKNRLKAILLACQDTLVQTKTLTDQYVSNHFYV